MNFLHGGFLLVGLASTALPLLIHLLLRRRRAPIEWAAMALLQEAIRRTNKRLRVEQLLLLSLRILVMALVGAALAVPFFGNSSTASSTRRLVVLVLDESVTTGLRVGNKTELQALVSEGTRTVRELGQGDRVALLYASQPARIEVFPTQDHAGVIAALERSAPSESAADFDAAFARVSEIAAESDTPISVIVLSKFRRGSLPEGSALAALPTRDEVPITIQLGEAATTTPSNTRITTVEPRLDVEGKNLLVLVQVQREGEELGNGLTRIWFDGDGVHPSTARVLNWDAGQTEASIELSAALKDSTTLRKTSVVTVHTSADALPIDDALFAVFETQHTVRVGVVGRRGSVAMSDVELLPASVWVARALAPTESTRDIQVVELDPGTIDSRALLGLDALIIARPTLITDAGWQSLRTYTERGGVLLLFPDGETDAQAWTTIMATTLRLPWKFASDAPLLSVPLRAAAEQPTQQASNSIFRAIDAELPALLAPLEFSRYLQTVSAPESDIALRLEQQSPLLLVARPGESSRGFVAFFLVSPELSWTNLPVKPAIVPLFQEILRSGLQNAGELQEGIVGERFQLTGESAGTLEHSSGASLGLNADGLTRDPIPLAGVWQSVAKQNMLLVANINNRATRLAPVPPAETRKYFSPTGALSTTLLSQPDARTTQIFLQSDSLALLLLIALAIILLTEGILSRVFSHASERRAAKVDTGLRGLGARKLSLAPRSTSTSTQSAQPQRANT